MSSEVNRKMTKEQRQLLAASKSFDADVERAEYIRAISGGVFRGMCARCDKMSVCHPGDCSDVGLYVGCRMAAVAAVAVGLIRKGGEK